MQKIASKTPVDTRKINNIELSKNRNEKDLIK
jgi:hypothetical protein